MKPRQSILPILMVVALVAGCSSGEDDLRAWMADSSKDLKPNLKPLPPIKQAVQVIYEGETLQDPFKPAKLDPDKKSGMYMPDANRRREPLEAYTLESLKMVGVLIKQGQTQAVIAADKTLHQVKVGNYMGQNYGQVTSISENEITLKELIEDASGEWTERITTLQLQELSPQEAKK